MGRLLLQSFFFLSFLGLAGAEVQHVNSFFEKVETPKYQFKSEIYIDGMIRITSSQEPKQVSYRVILKQRKPDANFIRYGLYLAVKVSPEKTEHYYVMGANKNEYDFTVSPQGELIEFAVFADYELKSDENGVSQARRLWFKNQNNNFVVNDVFREAESNTNSLNGNLEEYPSPRSSIYFSKY